MISGSFEGLQNDEMLDTTEVAVVASRRLTHEIVTENTYIDDEGKFLSTLGKKHIALFGCI